MMDEFYGPGLGLGGHMGYGIFFQLILFVLFLIVIYWVVKSGNISNESAEEILKKRLAKGEISKKEYESLRKEISK